MLITVSPMFEHIHDELVHCVHHLTDPELQRLCLQGGWFYLRGEQGRPAVDVDIGDPGSAAAHERVLHLITAPFEHVVELRRPREAGRPFPILREDLQALVLLDAAEITSALLEGLERVRSQKLRQIGPNLPVPEHMEEPMQPRQSYGLQ